LFTSKYNLIFMSNINNYLLKKINAY